ncbi:hypothetical protein ALC57_00571 [Trachymyrmex cornetzi]|uniref:Uncharacterized protein n=1 Tax=Trachymyrmex cornetzi TaxID=471704 RepID=A0A151JRW8_9HYME|nr:hypothetical protein ALC57_00571 [Trachymyrmex cornetzi]
MSYSHAEALDMIPILGERGGQFRATERLWQERYPNRSFKSDGSVNTHNYRYWAQENPHWF